jgi:hypothetical protein
MTPSESLSIISMLFMAIISLVLLIKSFATRRYIDPLDVVKLLDSIEPLTKRTTTPLDDELLRLARTLTKELPPSPPDKTE